MWKHDLLTILFLCYLFSACSYRSAALKFHPDKAENDEQRKEFNEKFIVIGAGKQIEYSRVLEDFAFFALFDVGFDCLIVVSVANEVLSDDTKRADYPLLYRCRICEWDEHDVNFIKEYGRCPSTRIIPMVNKQLNEHTRDSLNLAEILTLPFAIVLFIE